MRNKRMITSFSKKKFKMEFFKILHIILVNIW